MRDETKAIHFGYETDPTTKSVAVPIHQTVAYEFDNAQHGADLFDLAVPGNIYSRIMNPTCDVLEQRVAERTQELVRVNEALEKANAAAEEANIGKTRFIAAAGHDILQPLNAARLYATAMSKRSASTTGTDSPRRRSTATRTT